MAKQAKSVNKVVASSGNVFADLGLPDAGELDTKVRLAVAVNRVLESRRLTQAAAATALSVNQPKISALKHYKLEGFSVERLMTFLTALGSDRVPDKLGVHECALNKRDNGLASAASVGGVNHICRNF